jgi:OOP family OmpA-OmpF porin
MKTALSAMLCALALTLFAAFAFADSVDTEGCQDPPLFNRLPNYYISSCETNDFNFYNFPIAAPYDSVKRVEGKYWMVDYYVKEGQKASSPLAEVRNYKNAIEKAGGKIVWLDDTDMMRLTAKLTKNGAETWMFVMPRDLGSGLTVYIVQQEAMQQDITANAMMDSLKANGHIALAINFDTGKSTIKEESQPIIEQMVDLMKTNPDLKVEIQGHTDNVGDAKSNQKLSEDRAASVKKALVDKGIDAARMTSAGYGDTKPVADNKTDEGKAQNRRVELVKK